jgi:hypothetical protein
MEETVIQEEEPWIKPHSHVMDALTNAFPRHGRIDKLYKCKELTLSQRVSVKSRGRNRDSGGRTLD